MRILIDGNLIETDHLRCGKRTVEGTRCLSTAGDKGILHMATDEEGNIKFDVTCGTHLNKKAGDDVRFFVRQQAIDNAKTIIDSKATETI